MKYPQLVSAKSINIISDWLNKRLEELGIEEPEVHARHLLSLLHTPRKIHILDLEDLKQSRHLWNKDNDELKRLTAVEILINATPEANRSNIVNFVRELHMNLLEIENTEETSMLVRESNYASNSPISMDTESQKYYNKRLKKIKRHHANENPTKNYYKAFPALNDTCKASAMMVQQGGSIGGNKQLTTAWSNLMATSASIEKNIPQAIQHPSQQQQYHESVKMANQCKKKRINKGPNKRLQKAPNLTSNDVQLSSKTHNVSLSPKKMQKNVKSNASKAKYQRNFNDSSAKRTGNVNRNTMSNTAQNIAPTWDGANATLGPWDMDFKGNWEMDHDPISEFMQQQCHGLINSNNKKKICRESTNKTKFAVWEDEDFMKCLPPKLIDESLDDESDPSHFNRVKKPCVYVEDRSISSLHSKFDEKVKAIWQSGEDNEPAKSLTYKHQFSEDDGISLASLASSFASERHSGGLFNFNEQQQQPRNFIIEVNVPPFYNEMKSQFGGRKAYLTPDYDFNNNNNNMINGKQVMNNSFYGGRGVTTKSSVKLPPDNSHFLHPVKKSEFIELGTNIQKSIWSKGYVKDEKEVEYGVDEVDCTMKNLNSIGQELKEWQLCPEEVTLINHSDQSAFKKFKPQITSTIIRANYHPLNMDHLERSRRVESSCDSPIDNYLLSEKTHWSPIFKNGDFFTPDDRWDVIPYERSESGGLHYKNKTYQVWKAPSNISVTGNLDLDAIEEDALTDGKFVIKFALNENNKAIQTDEGAFGYMNTNNCVNNQDHLEINEYCRRKIYDEYNKPAVNEPVTIGGEANKWRPYQANEDSNDYSLFSVNRVKNNNNNNLMPMLPETQKVSSSNHSSSSSICTITSALENYSADNIDKWRNVNVETNINAIDIESRDTCKHSCWENCVNCANNYNQDPFFRPLPASRLLKDELKVDGEEIMNVIQNLYITSDKNDDEESEQDGCVAFDVNRVVNVILKDDIMEGFEPIVNIVDDESKFYENADELKEISQKSREQIIFENFDESALVKYHHQLDRDRVARMMKTHQQLPYTASIDGNNNEYQRASPLTNSRKRRHSTCQNYLEKKRYFSHEEGFSQDEVNPWSGPRANETAALFIHKCLKSFLDGNEPFLDPSKMVHINVENVFLIADPSLEMDYFNSQQHQQFQDCGANYYRNILQHQHALVKHLDLSRPLTR